jgi:hypothetical protein
VLLLSQVSWPARHSLWQARHSQIQMCEAPLMSVMFRSVGSGEKTRYYYFGKEVAKEEYDRLVEEHRPPQISGGVNGTSFVGWRPFYSEAMAYHPRQIPKAREHLEKHGAGTEIDNKGRPLIKSRQHRNQLMRLNGVHDNDGGYGDG